MRIAHAHGGTAYSGISRQLLIYKRCARPRRWQLRVDQLGLPHRRFYFLSYTVAVSDPALDYPRVGFNFQPFRLFALMVDQVFRDAANPVAAGLGAGAVRIVDYHSSRSAHGFGHHQNAIGSHSSSPIANPPSGWRIDVRSAFAAVEDDDDYASPTFIDEF